jgi:Flp pilus assembly pilin Flp
MAEYGVILAVLTVGVLGALIAFSGAIQDAFQVVNETISAVLYAALTSSRDALAGRGLPRGPVTACARTRGHRNHLREGSAGGEFPSMHPASESTRRMRPRQRGRSSTCVASAPHISTELSPSMNQLAHSISRSALECPSAEGR